MKQMKSIRQRHEMSSQSVMTQKKKSDIRFAFLGTSHIAVLVLSELQKAELIPMLVITPPAKPKGRGLSSAAVPAAIWAKENHVPLAHDLSALEKGELDVCIVVDFGAIIPETYLSLPTRGFLNVHPSLLPRFRGPSPMRTAILRGERETGVTIITLDAQVDHGPIVAQKKVVIEPWPPHLLEMEERLLSAGGELLAQVLPAWVAGEIEAREQDHDLATYTEKFTKEDGLLDLAAGGYENLLKIRAFEGWPGTYSFFERGGKKLRVSILDAHLEGGALVLDVVKPEGKKEMSYSEFLRSGAKPITR